MLIALLGLEEIRDMSKRKIKQKRTKTRAECGKQM
jgi:hypothetical protein